MKRSGAQILQAADVSYSCTLVVRFSEVKIIREKGSMDKFQTWPKTDILGSCTKHSSENRTINVQLLYFFLAENLTWLVL